MFRWFSKHSCHQHWTMRPHPLPPERGWDTASPSGPPGPREAAPWTPGWGWGLQRKYCQIHSPLPWPEIQALIYIKGYVSCTNLVAVLCQFHFLKNLLAISNICRDYSLEIGFLNVFQKLICFVREFFGHRLLLWLLRLLTLLIIRNAISIKIIAVDLEPR